MNEDCAQLLRLAIARAEQLERELAEAKRDAHDYFCRWRDAEIANEVLTLEKANVEARLAHATRFAYGDYRMASTEPGGPWDVSCPWKENSWRGGMTMNEAFAHVDALTSKVNES